jgi:hypothetical protein
MGGAVLQRDILQLSVQFGREKIAFVLALTAGEKVITSSDD